MPEIAINVESVSKDFLLPHERRNSIKSKVVNIFKQRDTAVEVQHALNGVSFEVKKGEFFGILGRNGSGKSTLLKILAEIYQPTNGDISVKGKLVPFIELGVGFNPELTGRENVYLNGALLGFSRKEIDKKYKDIVEFAELEEFMDQKLKNYSSGMQVRLAFSVATRSQADILLVDEVLAVGDADFQRKCYDFFKSLKKSGKTVVFVTHDMAAVREYCDRAILIEEGGVTHKGKAAKVAEEYTKLFIKNSLIDDVVSNEDKSDSRWGTGDITFHSVKHTITKEFLDISFVIKNNTSEHYDKAVDLGIDFYNEGLLVSGMHYLNFNDSGFTIEPHSTKVITVRFKNCFGGQRFTTNINLKVDGGNTVCDQWNDAFSFTNRYQEELFFRTILTPELFEIKEK